MCENISHCKIAFRDQILVIVLISQHSTERLLTVITQDVQKGFYKVRVCAGTYHICNIVYCAQILVMVSISRHSRGRWIL